MSKAPDLSGFPIPRKGAARPIEVIEEMRSDGQQSAADVSRREGDTQFISDEQPSRPAVFDQKQPERRLPPPQTVTAVKTSTGRLLATTVKLDEERYLRLQEAARPIVGRPRRRTIQDILTEALDEWLAKQGL